MKKAISLIVLVITIIVLGILATTAIISISDVNVIGQTQKSVNKYNLKQIAVAMQLEEVSMMIENGGKTPNVFELIERGYSKGIITEEQKEELMINGGELVIGEETLRLNVNGTAYCIGSELVNAEAPYSIRTMFKINKLPESCTFVELGCLITRKSLLDSAYPEVLAEEKFKLDAEEKYGFTIRKNVYGNYNTESSENTLKVLCFDIPENYEAEKVAVRAYVKYTYNGVDGIIYSDIIYTSVDSLK